MRHNRAECFANSRLACYKPKTVFFHHHLRNRHGGYSMRLFRNNKSSVSGLALVALVSVSSGFLKTTPAFAKAPAKAQPAILTASAIAVADKYSADAAEKIFKEGGNAVDAAVAIALRLP
ncbi:hypothetical protein P3T23_005698 [Paraburkholderia sp. GAS448]